MARLKGSIPQIDDAMREKWWVLYSKSAILPRLIATRFGINVGTVNKYLIDRRRQEGIDKPIRNDTVTIKSSKSPSAPVRPHL